jgi:hypothetical protein
VCRATFPCIIQVYINAPIEKFATSFRDVKKLKENKVYLDVQGVQPGRRAAEALRFRTPGAGIRRISTSCIPESGVKIAILGLDRFQSVNLAQDVISQIL